MSSADLSAWADSQIKLVQNGEMPFRGDFPEDMKGDFAKSLWFDVDFAYGMEYGYLHAMLELKKWLKSDAATAAGGVSTSPSTPADRG